MIVNSVTRFGKVLGGKYSYKERPYFWSQFGLLCKISLLSRMLWIESFIPTSGHTDNKRLASISTSLKSFDLKKFAFQDLKCSTR